MTKDETSISIGSIMFMFILGILITYTSMLRGSYFFMFIGILWTLLIIRCVIRELRKELRNLRSDKQQCVVK